MREIILTRGFRCFVDEPLYEVAKYYKWFVTETHANGATNYIAARDVKIDGMKMRVYLHRLAGGVPACFRVKFKDENWLNYQYDNLQIEDKRKIKYTYREFNKESKYKGVVFDYFYGLWRAEFFKMTIGYYRNEVDAARAYNIKMRHIYKNPGRHRLNKITIMEQYEENNPRYRRRA